MEDVRELIAWLLGGLSAILVSIGGFIFKMIFTKLADLESNQKDIVSELDKRLDKMEVALALNQQADEINKGIILEKLDAILQKMRDYDRNIANFYAENPSLKKPLE